MHPYVYAFISSLSFFLFLFSPPFSILCSYFLRRRPEAQGTVEVVTPVLCPYWVVARQRRLRTCALQQQGGSARSSVLYSGDALTLALLRSPAR
jgi:hypothetical protein